MQELARFHHMPYKSNESIIWNTRRGPTKSLKAPDGVRLHRCAIELRALAVPRIGRWLGVSVETREKTLPRRRHRDHDIHMSTERKRFRLHPDKDIPQRAESKRQGKSRHPLCSATIDAAHSRSLRRHLQDGRGQRSASRDEQLRDMLSTSSSVIFRRTSPRAQPSISHACSLFRFLFRHLRGTVFWGTCTSPSPSTARANPVPQRPSFSVYSTSTHTEKKDPPSTGPSAALW